MSHSKSVSVFLYNIHSGSVQRAPVIEVKKILEQLDWQGIFIEVGSMEELIAGIQSHAKKGSLVIVAGGDGSVRTALREVFAVKGVMGIVPIGTGNVLATHLGLAMTDAKTMIQNVVKGTTKNIDVGVANGEYFAVAVSMGVTARLMETTNQQKRRWGMLAYFARAFTALRERPVRYKITIDGQKFIVRAQGVVVANIGTTIAGIQASPGTTAESGDLGLIVISPGSLWSWIHTLFMALRGKVSEGKNVQNYKGSHFIIEPFSRARKWECDGDVIGRTRRLDITVYPNTLPIRVPATTMVSKIAEQKPVLIFDFDGTLADTFELMVTVYHAIAKDHGLEEFSNEQLGLLRGMSAREVIAYLKINPIKIPALLTQGRKLFFEHIREVQTFPGLLAVLKVLKQRYVLGIVTSNETETVYAFLQHHQMDLFDFVYSESHLFGKGRVLKHLLQSYSLNASQVTYVGDEVRDIEAARESGVRSVAVTWGFNTEAVLQSHAPDAVVHAPEELLHI